MSLLSICALNSVFILVCFVKYMKRSVGKILKSALQQTPLRRALMAYRHIGLSDADVFIASYPRSGNTWLRSMLSSCLFGEPIKSFRGKKNEFLPYIGSHRPAKRVVGDDGRLIKTHEPYRSEYKRAIWILRDPRDVCVSEYKLALRAQYFVGDLDEYVRLFVQRSPFQPANWMAHAQSWAASPIAGTDRLLPLRFEDMVTEPDQQLRRILKFLNVPFTSDMVEKAVRDNTVESMAARHAEFDRTLKDSHAAAIPAVNRGVAGGWRSQLSPVAVNLLHQNFGVFMREVGYETSS